VAAPGASREAMRCRVTGRSTTGARFAVAHAARMRTRQPGRRCGAASLLASSQGHESHGVQPFFLSARRSPLDETQRLIALPTGTIILPP